MTLDHIPRTEPLLMADIEAIVTLVVRLVFTHLL
jgi:hypothetical protein